MVSKILLPDMNVHNLKTPFDVCEIIDKLEYSFTNNHTVRSAKKTLELGKGNCIESMLAAGFLMEKLNFPFKAFGSLLTKGSHLIHIVYYYCTEEGYFSIAKSRCSELCSRRTPFQTIEELRQSYNEGFKKEGLKLIMSFELNETELPIDWRYSEESLDNPLKKVLKNKFRAFLKNKLYSDE